MKAAPRFRIVAAQAFERDVHLRLPFRFGAATVNAAPQAFVRVLVRTEDGREAEGVAAELMIPKWFDKSPDKTNDDNIDDLRGALLDACAAYTSDSPSRNGIRALRRALSVVAGPAARHRAYGARHRLRWRVARSSRAGCDLQSGRHFVRHGVACEFAWHHA